MSTQGTGAIASNGFERHLLESWGAWSRSGDLGLGYGRSGYAPIELLIKRGDTIILFSDDEILQADGVICGLPVRYNTTIKKVFLHGKWGEVAGDEISAAVKAFSESLRERISSGC